MALIFGFISFYVFVIFQKNVNGANILFLHSYASYSHRISMMPLANALISRGHNVTYIAPMSAETPNPKMLDIIPETFKTFVDNSLNAQFDVTVRIAKETPNLFTMFDQLFAQSCEVLLTSLEFQAWLKTSPKIDLVVADLVPDCGVGIAYKLNAKIILYNTVAFYGKMVELFKVPDEALTTYCDQPYKPAMSFFEKIKSTLLPLGWAYYEHKNVPYLESVLREGLNITKLPSIYELYQNISLIFLTGNYVTEQPRSLPPMFVSVPGLHLKRNRDPLPVAIEQFINSDADTNEGFIYISLGTLVVAPNLPIHTQNVFMNTIRKFPKIKFLWRWGGAFPTNLPKNLYMAQWFPQQSILSHAKIRAFITQGGRPSLQEAIFHGVPLVALPILGDQDFNAMRLEEIGVAIALEISEITEHQLQSAVSRVLHGSFKTNVKKMSTIFKDLPMKPIDTAVWWTEYVLRHDDMSLLKPMGRNLTWYERRNLDVWLTLFLAGVFTVFCIIALLISTCKFVQSCITTSKLKTL